MKMENRSHRYNINRPMDTNIVNTKSVIWSNIWSSIHEKLNKTDAELTSSVAYKKKTFI